MNLVAKYAAELALANVARVAGLSHTINALVVQGVMAPANAFCCQASSGITQDRTTIPVRAVVEQASYDFLQRSRERATR